MLTNIKKLIIKKNNGNVTSLIFGQLFIFLMIVWCLFSYRLTILNAVFNYVDDSLTGSCLGAALVNVEEYGKSNQLIIHNNEGYKKTNWETEEGKILLSELNFGSDITLTEADLDKKQVMDYDYRNNPIPEENYKDTYLRRALSAFAYCMSYNLSNGRSEHVYRAENIIGDVSGTGGYQNIKTINHDSILNESFLGDYITSDIEVTRFDIYSVYRDRLAARHVYASEYLLYSINGRDYKYEDLSKKIINQQAVMHITWNTADPKVPYTDEEFENLFRPHKWELKDEVKDNRSKTRKITESDYKLDENGLKIENEAYSSQLLAYNRKYDQFRKDRDFYEANNSNGKLICYTDTQTTYQGLFNKNEDGTYVDRVPFNYFFVDSNGVSPGALSTNTGGIYGNDIKKCENGKKAPIEYWSLYSYNNGGTTFTSTQYTGGEELKPKIEGGKLGGLGIENTSIYVELTFNIKVFPTMTGTGFFTKENTKEVTIGRLVDIESNTDIK